MFVTALQGSLYIVDFDRALGVFPLVVLCDYISMGQQVSGAGLALLPGQLLFPGRRQQQCEHPNRNCGAAQSDCKVFRLCSSTVFVQLLQHRLKHRVCVIIDVKHRLVLIVGLRPCQKSYTKDAVYV